MVCVIPSVTETFRGTPLAIEKGREVVGVIMGVGWGGEGREREFGRHFTRLIRIENLSYMLRKRMCV